MKANKGYLVRCTLVYGNIYGQILIWLLIIFLSLASGLALIADSHSIAGAATIVLVFCVVFALFAVCICHDFERSYRS
jgi:hypothetical protein